MSEPTLRDLAALDEDMGGGDLLSTTLYALASPQSGEVGTDRCIEFVAAQVYDDAADDATTEQASEYVQAFLDVFGIEDLSDVDGLLGRQAHVESNYMGQLAFVGR